MKTPLRKTAPTYWIRLYVAGDYHKATVVAKRYCDKVGLCITIDPTTYVYTEGVEEGVVVGFINYPRFPMPPEVLMQHATEIAEAIVEKCNQHSYYIMTPTNTYWYSKRSEDLTDAEKETTC